MEECLIGPKEEGKSFCLKATMVQFKLQLPCSKFTMYFKVSSIEKIQETTYVLKSQKKYNERFKSFHISKI